MIYKSFNFANCFVVDRNGLGGGLALLWGADVNVNITSYNPYHIDAVVSSECGLVWRCTRIYSHLELSKKHNTWTLLKRLANFSSYPWCCFGDFNEVMHMYEKSGGNEKNVNVVIEFREVVQNCNLIDIGCKGYLYTWSNRRFGTNYIEEWLDRFLYSKDWGNKFQDFTAANLINWVSDHCPIVLEFKERCKKLRTVSRLFPRDHYEDMWSSYEDCRSIIRDEWGNYGLELGRILLTNFSG